MDNGLNLNNSSSSNNISTVAENVQQISHTDTLWILISTVLVFIMILGLALFYSGFVRRINTLSIFTALSLTSSVVVIQWFLFGYSLTFSKTGSKMIGNFDHILMNQVNGEPNIFATTIPSNVFMIFQALFAAITPCLFFGSVAERVTITGFVAISIIWTSVVYDFIAYWTWNKNGWLNVLGTLDFAGGGPVHIASGFSALAFALAIGPRRTVNTKKLKPVNLTEIFIGTSLLWFGWFGFNAGSEGSMNARSINAAVTTNFAACSGGVSWVLIEMIFHRTKKVSLNAFCTGAVASLVSITPACGFVDLPTSLLFGFITTLLCFLAGFIKKFAGKVLDDACDVFAVHGVGGITGSILTGIFAKNSVAALDGSFIPGGLVDGNSVQVGYQAIAIVVSAAWAFVITFILVKLYSFLPFLKLRLDEEEEKVGSDLVELGEIANDVQSSNEKSKTQQIPEQVQLIEPGSGLAFYKNAKIEQLALNRQKPTPISRV